MYGTREQRKRCIILDMDGHLLSESMEPGKLEDWALDF